MTQVTFKIISWLGIVDEFQTFEANELKFSRRLLYTAQVYFPNRRESARGDLRMA